MKLKHLATIFIILILSLSAYAAPYLESDWTEDDIVVYYVQIYCLYTIGDFEYADYNETFVPPEKDSGKCRYSQNISLLPYGKYIFKISGVNHDGIGESSTKTIKKYHKVWEHMNGENQVAQFIDIYVFYKSDGE